MLADVKESEIAGVLDQVSKRYAKENPKSALQYNVAARHLPGGNTRVVLHYDPFPIVIDHAEKGRVFDIDGHAYLDFTNDFTAALYGHSNPVIVGALRSALERGIGYGAPTEHEARLALAICTRVPSVERVRFCNSGTEANLFASQIARIVTGRSVLLAFAGAYHGSMMSYLPGMAELNVDGGRVVLARFNDIDSVRNAVMEIGADLAAIIVEPMMGSAGGIIADREFLQFLRESADDAGAMLIYDEVQTARLSFGGLQEVFGIDPDLTTLGKFVGGGLSFGAFGGRAEIMDRLDPSRTDRIAHGGTFNNNVLTMIAGFTGLTQLATREALDELNARADRLRLNLRDTARSHGLPLQVGGLGSILSLHFQAELPRHPGEVTTPAPWRKLLHLEMLQRDIYVPRRGTLSLSLESMDDHCGAFLEAFGDILSEHADLARALLK